MSGKAAVKMCRAQWKSREPRGRACRGAARAKTQHTQHTGSGGSQTTRPGLPWQRWLQSAASSRGWRRGGVPRSESCEDFAARGQASIMATKWFTGAPFGVQSHRWGGVGGGWGAGKRASDWRAYERGLEPGDRERKGGRASSQRWPGGTLYPPPGSAFPCPESFNFPIKLFKILSEGPTMCCSERPSGLSHSRSLSQKIVRRISAQVSFFIHMYDMYVGYQFSSVAQSCLTLCDSMDCSTPGFPVHQQLLELTQSDVHQVSDAIQPSHPVSSLSPPAFNFSQHQGLFQ